MTVSENPQSKETLQAVESWIELRKERPHNRIRAHIEESCW